MSVPFNNFLSGGQSTNLSDGTAEIVAASLSTSSLDANLPCVTDSSKNIQTRKIEITDCSLIAGNPAISDIDLAGFNISNIDIIETNELISAATPSAGKLHVYAKNDSHLYIKNSSGTETNISDNLGDVTGPSSSVTNQVSLFADTTGKLLSTSQITMDGSGVISNINSISALGNGLITLSSTLNSEPSIILNSNHANSGVEIQHQGTDRIRINATGLSFFDATPISKPTINGSRHGNVALGDLLSDLQLLGLITNNSTAGTASTGDVTAASNMTTNTLLQGDGGAKGIQDTTITVTNDDELSGVQYINLLVDPFLNTSYGFESGNSGTTHIANTAIGHQALKVINTGSYSTAIGYDALEDATNNSHNTAIGSQTLKACDAGEFNSVLGSLAMIKLRSGNNNVAIGKDSLDELVAGSNNVAIGFEAGNALTTNDSNNILIGNTGVIGDNQKIKIGNAQTFTMISGIYNITPLGGSDEMVIVDAAGRLGSQTIPVVSGGDVTAAAVMTNNTIIIGDGGAKGVQDSTITVTNDDELGAIQDINLLANADTNTHFGYQSRPLNQGVNNTSIGHQANRYTAVGGVNTTIAIGGFANANLDDISGTKKEQVAIGFECMSTRPGTGDGFNTAVGYRALRQGGERNVAIGHTALESVSTGQRNTAVGMNALCAITTESYNTAIGYDAGDAQNGDNNICIGYQCLGYATDSQTFRVGDYGAGIAGPHITRSFIRGIHSVAPAAGDIQSVIIDDEGQLGSQSYPYPPLYLDGGGIEWVSTSTVNVKPVMCRDVLNTFNIELAANSLLDMTASGAGGLQVAESSNQMYKVYVIADSTGVNPTAAYGVPQATGISFPAGYDKERVMGHIKNNSSSNIMNFEMFNKGRDRQYHYHESRSDLEVYNGSGTAGVFQNLDLVDLIPLEVDTCDFSVELDMDADTHKFYMQSGLNSQSVANSLVVYGSGIQAANFGFSDFTVYNQSIDRNGGTGSFPGVEWATDVVGQDVTISVSSYVQNL